MKIAVIGANGQLGSDVCEEFQKNRHEVFKLTHDTLEVSDIDSVSIILKQIMPNIVVNTAAMHNLDACEQYPLQSFKVNALGARNLAMVTKEISAVLIHISTDYVFDGKHREPYVEQDMPIPINVYGNTKLSGEHFIESIAEKYFILRVSGLYGMNPCRAKGGLNFVKLMLKLAKERDEIRVVDDEILTPTYTVDVAQQIVEIAKTDNYGLFHATAQGSCSWYEFAARIFEITKSNVKLLVADPNEFPTKVTRPKYSVLENANLKAVDLDIMPHWSEGLKKYLEKT